MKNLSPKQASVLRWMWFALPFYMWAAILLTLTSIPGQRMPEIGVWNWDKFAHSGVYAVLYLLLYRYVNQGFSYSGKALIRSGWIALVFAAFDEIHQIFIPNRCCTLMDYIADAIGVLAAALFIFVWKRKSHV